jgi:orotate phosphoribosyltransferase
LDRKERGNGSESAIQEVERDFSLPVVSIIDIDDILIYLEQQPDSNDLVNAIKEYRTAYGVS